MGPKCLQSVVVDSATYLLKIISPGIDSVAMILYGITKVTDEHYTTIIQSTAGHFNLRVFVNCLQVSKYL